VTAICGEGGDESGVTPAAVLATSEEALRAAGLSGRKVEYITGASCPQYASACYLSLTV